MAVMSENGTKKRRVRNHTTVSVGRDLIAMMMPAVEEERQRTGLDKFGPSDLTRQAIKFFLRVQYPHTQSVESAGTEPMREGVRDGR